MKRVVLVAGLVLALGGSVAVGMVIFNGNEPERAPRTTETHLVFDIARDPDVPDLPFDDNPDPSQCGIPVQWGDNGQAWLSGTWEGELIQPDVLLYNSHLRTSVTASAAHGSEVEILLFQENPVLDYYFVRIPGDPTQEGWVPEPFLSFDPVT